MRDCLEALGLTSAEAAPAGRMLAAACETQKPRTRVRAGYS